jgi:hypothetical protein
VKELGGLVDRRQVGERCASRLVPACDRARVNSRLKTTAWTTGASVYPDRDRVFRLSVRRLENPDEPVEVGMLCPTCRSETRT